MNMTKAYPHTARKCGHRHGGLVISPVLLLLSITCIWLLLHVGMAAIDDKYKKMCVYTQWQLPTEEDCLSWCRWCHPSSPFCITSCIHDFAVRRTVKKMYATDNGTENKQYLL